MEILILALLAVLAAVIVVWDAYVKRVYVWNRYLFFVLEERLNYERSIGFGLHKKWVRSFEKSTTYTDSGVMTAVAFACVKCAYIDLSGS